MLRNILLFGVVFGLALIVLAFFGLTPKVLVHKVQAFGTNATGAAVETRHLSDKRERRVNDATSILDGLPKKD